VGLLYLCAAAKRADPDLEVSVLDLNHALLVRSQEPNFDYNFWKDAVTEEIRREPQVFVGVSCMFGATKPIFEEIASYIKEHFRDVPVITGGVQATYDYDEILQKGVCDLVFLKESEDPFTQFLAHCREGKAAEMPRGMAFRQGKALHVSAPVEGTAPVNLDIRPFYKLLDVPNYYKYGSLAAFSRYNGEDKPFATVLSNRAAGPAAPSARCAISTATACACGPCRTSSTRSSSWSASSGSGRSTGWTTTCSSTRNGRWSS
jgi:hypothetical protein